MGGTLNCRVWVEAINASASDACRWANPAGEKNRQPFIKTGTMHKELGHGCFTFKLLRTVATEEDSPGNSGFRDRCVCGLLHASKRVRIDMVAGEEVCDACAHGSRFIVVFEKRVPRVRKWRPQCYQVFAFAILESADVRHVHAVRTIICARTVKLRAFHAFAALPCSIEQARFPLRIDRLDEPCRHSAAVP